MSLPDSTITQLMAARHLYYIAKQNIESSQMLRLFAGINLLHDSVEATLWAAAAYKNVGRDRSEIMQLYDDLSKSLTPQSLSFRSSVVQLNKLRVNSKHYGICPDRKETEKILVSMTEFLRETTNIVFDQNFWTISLLDLLTNGEIRKILETAQEDFNQHNYLQTLIECRKVIFLVFERWYTIDKFRDAPKSNALFSMFGMFTKAPYYCRNAEWIQKNVKDPFGYIVLDHEDVNKDLLTAGIDTETFWNIWRGTPEVFRYDGTTRWLVKRELAKEASGANEEHAAYMLEQTIDIALRHEEHRRRIRTIGSGISFFVMLKQDHTNIYSKADRSSTVNMVTEEGMSKIRVTESTVGLTDDGTYWKVVDDNIGNFGTWYFGYIHNDDIDWSKANGHSGIELVS